MSSLGKWVSVLLAVGSLGVVGCGGAKMGAPATPSGPSQGQASAVGDSAAPAPAEQSAAGYGPGAAKGESAGAYGQPAAAPTSMGGSGSSSDMARSREAAEPRPGDRPGLGTAWGETMQSRTTTAPFLRDSVTPFAVASFWYNDRVGAEAMSRWADYRSHDRGVSDVLGGALTVSLRSERGNVLPGFFAGGKQYVIGEAGERYIIVVRNNTNFRFECVASVDGLDVIDGTTAAYTKRGYLIQPYGVLEIEGFRRSAEAVAAFRFSSVRGSYAERSGQDARNVGVIGVAFFNEQGTRPTWSPDEIQRRHDADPFPGRYAVPPSN